MRVEWSLSPTITEKQLYSSHYFRAALDADDITLKNCPAHIRESITRERKIEKCNRDLPSQEHIRRVSYG